MTSFWATYTPEQRASILPLFNLFCLTAQLRYTTRAIHGILLVLSNSYGRAKSLWRTIKVGTETKDDDDNDDDGTGGERDSWPKLIRQDLSVYTYSCSPQLVSELRRCTRIPFNGALLACVWICTNTTYKYILWYLRKKKIVFPF